MGISLGQVLESVERATLGAIRHALEGRALVRRTDDPVLPWVSRLAEGIFEGMKAQASRDQVWMDRAREEWAALMQDLEAQIAEWRAEGNEDYVRRVSLVLSKRVPW